MPWRNLFPKKRGGRRTGRRSVGHWSELLLSLSLVVIGGGALLLHVFQVLLPDWREARELRGFERGVCEITQTRIVPHENPLGVTDYVVEIQASLITEQGQLPPVWLDSDFGDSSPSRSDALHLERMFQTGEQRQCWYDPAQPSRLVLRRSHRWWPWPVALIPASLLAVGVWGIVASLMQVATSAERRSMVSAKALRLDPLRESPETSPVKQATDASSVAVPAVTHSGGDASAPPQPVGSGAQQPYRLYPHGATAWRVAGLFLVCGIWNTLLAYFCVVASRQFLRDDLPLLALVLVVMLGLVGVWLAFHLVREFWQRRGIGPSQLEVSEHPLAVGGTYRAYFLQIGRMQLESLAVLLVCEESASYQQGTDSRTEVLTVYQQQLRLWRGLNIEPGQPFEADLNFAIPESAMHSFRSPHNEVRWLLCVRGKTEQQQVIDRRFTLRVRPAVQDVTSDLIAEGASPAQGATV